MKKQEQSYQIFLREKAYDELLRTEIAVLKTYADINDQLKVEKVNEIVRNIDPLKTKTKIYPENKSSIALNLGVIAENNHEYNLAKAYYEEGLKIAKEKQNNERIAQCLINIGTIYRKQQKFSKAKTYLTEALPYRETKYSVYNNLADVYNDEGAYKEALIYYQKAIDDLLKRETGTHELLNEEVLKLSGNKIDLLECLIGKADALSIYFDKTQQKEYLENALKTYVLADQLIDIIYVESREDLSKLFWRKKGADLYLKAVSVCNRLSENEKAFYFMEKNKALLLLENITDFNAKQLANLPKNVIEKEYRYLNTIKDITYKISQVKEEEKQFFQLKDSLFNQKRNYEKFVDSLELSYPLYHNYKKQIKIRDLVSVQKKLRPEESVVQYILGAQDGYVLLVTQYNATLYRLQKVPELHEELRLLRTFYENPLTTEEEQQDYKNLAHRIYQKIIPKNIIAIDNSMLTIIPDNVLQYIPFEALTLNRSSSLEEDYLLNFCTIRYAYSMSLQAKVDELKEQKQYNFIGFAPSMRQYEDLNELEENENETKAIAPIFLGRTQLGEEANKEIFLNTYHQYQIVHVSTHGGVDNDIPWLAFSDEKLMLNELYFNESQSDLVVLSACKTAQGALKKGEGVWSIARSFFGAGTKSVLSSLWNLNERSSSEILFQFYQNIEKGQQKDIALSNAKKAYLKKHQHTSNTSPYYWSAFVFTGNAEAITLSTNNGLYFGVLVMMMAVAFFYYRKR